MLWREEHLLEILRAGRLNTSEVVARADMSKATALKYLEGLKGKRLISCEMITKLWSIVGETKEDVPAQFDQEKIRDFISVDRGVFRLLEEFEGITGKGLRISINKAGLNLNMERVT
jgi:hypothetical protein